MNTLLRTDEFITWFQKLKNPVAKARIAIRPGNVQEGNLGDYKSVGDGVFELRIDFGAGYRIYYAQEGIQIYVILAGGDKTSQERDIKLAKILWKEIKEAKSGKC